MGKLVSSVANIFTGADNSRAAGEAAAAEQRRVAEASTFRPVGMTTRLGTSTFTREIDPKTGLPYISSAGYTAAPELQDLQNRLFGSFAGSLPSNFDYLNPLSTGASRAFGLGEGYLAMSPQQAEEDYVARTQALLAPQREQELAGLRTNLFARGRTGLATGGTRASNMMATNPELAALYNSRALQDLQITQQAREQAQQNINFGLGLYNQGGGLFGLRDTLRSQAYSPLQTVLGLSGNVEQMAQQPFQLGLQLGTAQQPGQQAYQQGVSQAATTQANAIQQANAANAGFWSGLISGAANVYGRSRQGTGSIY